MGGTRSAASGCRPRLGSRQLVNTAGFKTGFFVELAHTNGTPLTVGTNTDAPNALMQGGVVVANSADALRLTLCGLKPGTEYAVCLYARGTNSVKGRFAVDGSASPTTSAWFVDGGDHVKTTVVAGSDGLSKDRYWLYRARWNRNVPTLHLVPHWTWPGREGQQVPVYVYTSFPSAELFVNGKSQGRKTFDRTSQLDRYRLRWRDVVYAPGELKVVAYDAQGRAAAMETVRTAGPFARFDEKARDFGRLRFVTVTAVDASGTACPDHDGRYEVKVPEGWAFKAVCNGDATSLEPFTQPKMRLFKGRLVYILERSP